jgi:N-carbamoyl-L-amino-acid hydrolase
MGAPIGVASAIWPHGRWRLELKGQANHAGTTRLADREDPMLALAAAVLAARRVAGDQACVATVGKVRVEPNAVNAIASQVTAWLDARGPAEQSVRAVAAEVARAASTSAVEESFTEATVFDGALRERVVAALGGPPVLPTGAGHDAGILAVAGIPTAMVFVRNPTGVSHSPAEAADRADCTLGVEALTRVLIDLSGAAPLQTGPLQTGPLQT